MTVPFQARIARDVVVVDGPDATSFLHSLVSQDLEPVAVGASAHSLLLQPQGKLLVDFVALRDEPDTWWCVCEGGFGPTLADGLNRFKIRVKADVHEVAVSALAVRGVQPPAAPGVRLVTVDWPGGPAFDALGDDDAVAALSDGLGVPLVDAETFERERIEAGIARQGYDVDERTIPQEAGLELTAVSFTKGCFLGQELVCRIDTRGHVNRNLRRLRAAGAVLPRGATVVADGKAVGEVTSTAGPVALAMLRREIEPDARVTVDEIPAVVEAL